MSNPRLNPQHPINDEPRDPIEATGDYLIQDVDEHIRAMEFESFLDSPDHGC